jgi:hypothetical protein
MCSPHLPGFLGFSRSPDIEIPPITEAQAILDDVHSLETKHYLCISFQNGDMHYIYSMEEIYTSSFEPYMLYHLLRIDFETNYSETNFVPLHPLQKNLNGSNKRQIYVGLSYPWPFHALTMYLMYGCYQLEATMGSSLLYHVSLLISKTRVKKKTVFFIAESM